MPRRRALTALASAAFACLSTLSASAQPPAAAAPVPWIDAHVHLVGGRGSQSDFPGAVHAAVQDMDRFGIAMALVMPPPQTDSQSPYDHGSYTTALARFPGRFAFLAGGGSLNPTIHRYANPANVTDSVKAAFVREASSMLDAGAVGFGEIAALHVSAVPGHPYESVPPDHPLLLALADVAAKRGVPIDLHMDAVEGESAPPARLTGSNPARLPDTLGAFPRLLAHNRDAKIVWAHGGSDPIGAMSPAAIGRLMDAHPNLYVSLRIHGRQSPTHHKVFTNRDELDPAWSDLLTRHADRFVTGTDTFATSPNLRGSGPGWQFAERNEPKLRATVHFLSLLPAEVAQKIGRDNAIRIYKLTVR